LALNLNEVTGAFCLVDAGVFRLDSDVAFADSSYFRSGSRQSHQFHNDDQIDGSASRQLTSFSSRNLHKTVVQPHVLMILEGDPPNPFSGSHPLTDLPPTKCDNFAKRSAKKHRPVEGPFDPAGQHQRVPRGVEAEEEVRVEREEKNHAGQAAVSSLGGVVEVEVVVEVCSKRPQVPPPGAFLLFENSKAIADCDTKAVSKIDQK